MFVQLGRRYVSLRYVRSVTYDETGSAVVELDGQHPLTLDPEKAATLKKTLDGVTTILESAAPLAPAETESTEAGADPAAEPEKPEPKKTRKKKEAAETPQDPPADPKPE